MFRFNPSPQKIVFSINPSPRWQQSVSLITSKREQTRTPFKYRRQILHDYLRKQVNSTRGTFLPLFNSQPELSICNSSKFAAPSDVDSSVSISRNRGSKLLKMSFIDLNSTTCFKENSHRNCAASQFQKAAIHRLRVREQIKQRRKLLPRSIHTANPGLMQRGNSVK